MLFHKRMDQGELSAQNSKTCIVIENVLDMNVHNAIRRVPHPLFVPAFSQTILKH